MMTTMLRGWHCRFRDRDPGPRPVQDNLEPLGVSVVGPSEEPMEPTGASTLFPVTGAPSAEYEPVLRTPIGTLVTHVVCGDVSTQGARPEQAFRVPSGALLNRFVRSAWVAELLVGPVKPRTPGSLEIAGCLAAIWRIRAIERCGPCRICCSWSKLPDGAEGGPNSGEGLDAITWEVGSFALSLGTEDGEFLSGRAGRDGSVPARLALELRIDTVEYVETGLVVPFSGLEPAEGLQVQFVVAWGDRDTANLTWLAVEQDPSNLLNQLLDPLSPAPP